MNWHTNAIFYELYLRAFADGNGDGHGDFIGLRQKLDYLQWLGVDCISSTVALSGARSLSRNSAERTMGSA